MKYCVGIFSSICSRFGWMFIFHSQIHVWWCYVLKYVCPDENRNAVEFYSTINIDHWSVVISFFLWFIVIQSDKLVFWSATKKLLNQASEVLKCLIGDDITYNFVHSVIGYSYVLWLYVVTFGFASPKFMQWQKCWNAIKGGHLILLNKFLSFDGKRKSSLFYLSI